MTRQVAFACNIARPKSQGHAQERTSCADQPPLPAQPFSPACATPGEPAFGSALRHRAGAGGDGQARRPDRNVQRPKATCAGDIPRQATHPSAPLSSFFKVHSICAQRPALHLRREAQRSGVRCKRVLGGRFGNSIILLPYSFNRKCNILAKPVILKILYTSLK